MSRLSKKPIPVPEGVIVREEGHTFLLKGPRGEERVISLPFVLVAKEGERLHLTRKGDSKQARANIGTMTSLLKNAIEGVMKGFSKTLEIQGVGYRAAMEGKTLILSLGFVNPIRFEPPEGVVLTVEKNTITVSGNSKGEVTQTAANIRALKKPEPYKGKGIYYRGEIVRRKVGKKAQAVKT